MSNASHDLEEARKRMSCGTSLHFRLAHEGEKTLRIFDMLDKDVRTFAAVRKLVLVR